MDPEFFFMITVGLPVLCGTLIIITVLLAGGKKKGVNATSNEETQMLQEMHQSLIRMEKRIDALETIYFEIDRTSKGHGNEL